MNPDDLQKILDDHKLWLADPTQGKRADLTGANLRGADLTGADQYEANFFGCKR